MINTRAVAVFSYGYIPEISSINLGFPWVLTEIFFSQKEIPVERVKIRGYNSSPRLLFIKIQLLKLRQKP